MPLVSSSDVLPDAVVRDDQPEEDESINQPDQGIHNNSLSWMVNGFPSCCLDLEAC